ncbi:MAG: hypothetical protein M3Q75_07335 [Gemmatimonadota bacterium]|nr:hypothetical protein [Gemmatimonadota bacterium]
MRRVYKYPVPVAMEFTLEIPVNAEVLTVQTQGGVGSIWILVDPDAPVVQRRFRVVLTGREAPPWHYVGTFQLDGGAMVLHLFEECVA